MVKVNFHSTNLYKKWFFNSQKKKIFAVGKKAIDVPPCPIVSGGQIEIHSIVSASKLRFKTEKW